MKASPKRQGRRRLIAGSDIPGRQTYRRRSVLASLRQDLMAGRIAPGEQLPTRAELVARFKAGPLTIQRALEQLEREGFVRTMGRRGTFVTERPPHRSRFALVFTNHPSFGRTWPESPFATALAGAAEQFNREGDDVVEIVTGVNDVDSAHKVRQSLLTEARHGRLAGIILEHPYVRGFAQTLGVPCVSFCHELHPHIMSINMDRHGWYRAAIDHVASQGRRRVAIVGQSSADLDAIDANRDYARQRGVAIHPGWCQGVDPRHRHWARHAVQAMFMPGDPAQRPDALLIIDDSLIEHACAGLIALHRRVPEDVLIVGHANFPYLTTDVLPMHRLGWDVRDVLGVSLELIRQHHAGSAPPKQPVMVELRTSPATALESRYAM